MRLQVLRLLHSWFAPDAYETPISEYAHPVRGRVMYGACRQPLHSTRCHNQSRHRLILSDTIFRYYRTVHLYYVSTVQ